MAGSEFAKAYFESLIRTERISQKDLADYQSKLLRSLAEHAIGSTPFYSDRARPPVDLASDTLYWLAQPLVTRKDLVENFGAFAPYSSPRLHGPTVSFSTGGSTGPAARRDLTSLESMARLLVGYRMYHNWRLDQSRPLFVFRKARGGGTSGAVTWGFPWERERSQGGQIWIDIATPAPEQLRAMADQGPVYVNTFPSNILRLAVEALRSNVRLSIPHMVSVGEYLAPEVRVAAERAFGSTIIDAFSSAEGGVIAIQCPEAGLYHIQSEQVLAEILSAEGRPCAAGETGEVIVTPLYGYATPLLRYRSGDYVEAGPACTCGRTLPTISRIVGRMEHMFKFPDGTRRLPEIDRVLITQAVGHDQWALVQQTETEVVFRHVGPLTAGGRRLILQNLDHAWGAEFQLDWMQVSQLPLTSGGKRHFTFNEMPARPS